MMNEVLNRRLKHEDWNFPNLIIVDGGKGQVTSGLAALEEQGVAIPLVGLAKREETIIIPTHNQVQQSLSNTFSISQADSPFIEVSLPKNSPSLHLIQRIRDEAHRFAITYHRKLRSNNINKPEV